jgi:hypothetical protein
LSGTTEENKLRCVSNCSCLHIQALEGLCTLPNLRGLGRCMLCLFGLAPASPLVTAAAFFYFLICTPTLRWTMIFLCKPKFDMGGCRFKFIFDMCVSGMVVGQILLVAMMSSKRAAVPALLAALPLIPTIAFRYSTRRRYLKAFSDVALLQSSLLDGWDTNEETSPEEKRQEFRRLWWIVTKRQ